jgi:hypothetical protein
MIKHWLKLALQSTYQGGARYAGARTRYGLTATRARHRRRQDSRGSADDERLERAGGGRDDRFTSQCETVLPAIDAEPLRGPPMDHVSQEHRHARASNDRGI